MEKRLQDVLENRCENYILPFFWQHGETKELIEEGLDKIHESGIGAVCVESRPHPDFLRDGWWRDMDIIMAKAKKLNMRVWVLDDAHFPSGYCNGQIKDDLPYGKTYLTHYTVDVVGPVKGNAFMVKAEPDECLIGVTLSKRSRQESFYQTEVMDVTDNVTEGKVYIDIPDGVYAITVMKTTRRGSGRKNYINSIDKNAVKFFIDTVYEAHFKRYADDFGDTFAGFFSDEPEIGNCLGEYVNDAYIGQPTMALPWCEELEAKLRTLWGEDFVKNLLAMWVNIDEYQAGKYVSLENKAGFSDNRPEWAQVPKGWTERQFIEQVKRSNKTGLLRRQLMEIVSELYGRNFTAQIGDWCRKHNVEYIGHVIEDGGNHAHLGMGTGHFFKALWGQDMSGIDVVLQQIRPQFDDFAFYSVGGKGFYHGELFHYGLAKMGTSLGHLDAKKKGRTMCEVFGAYGWAEGLKQMKWIIDHMLVRGVNYFVPHAFTMKDFPDSDCPPHFYARGNNPQFPYFKYLMEYTNRVSHLTNGGKHIPVAALLYTAEQEWMGPARKFEKDAKELTRGQIDFEVVPEEVLLSAKVNSGRLVLREEEVSALVIPGSYCISKALADKCLEFVKQGVKVFFTESLDYILDEDGNLGEVKKLQADKSVKLSKTYMEVLANEGEICELTDRQGEILGMLVPADSLIKTLRNNECYELSASEYQRWLRYYHYRQAGGDFYLFFGEAITEGINTYLTIKNVQDEMWWYDPWLNRLSPCDKEADGSIRLKLSPYEMKVLYIGNVSADIIKKYVCEKKFCEKVKKKCKNVFDLTEEKWSEELGDWSKADRKPYFTGEVKYRTTFTLPKDYNGEDCYLDLGEVYETAKVTVNGQTAGIRIAPPYTFEIGELVHPGDNILEISVANTLVHKLRDFLSMTLPMEPSGLLGPVKIRY